MDEHSLELSFSSCELANKAGKKGVHDKIKHYECALLNSKGGKLTLCLLNGTADKPLKADDIVRPIEQYFQNVLDTDTIHQNIEISHRTFDKITVAVKGCKSLCTLDYNLYLPTDTQVLSIRPVENERVKEILDVNKLVDVTEVEGCVPTTFILGRPIGVQESKTVQFKHLKAEKKGSNDLSGRIISNNLTHYVSAFANYRGGRIYCGVRDDGVVKGESITEKDKRDVSEKVAKYIAKMKWPDDIVPRRGAQWEVSFKAVVDSDGNAIQSTYVIVIFVAACPGGVFTKEPESYHIVDGEVKEMTLAEWKERLLYSNEEPIARTMSRCDWSTTKVRLQCDALDGKLLRLINIGKWSEFERVANEEGASKSGAELDEEDVQVSLVVLSKWFVYYYRKEKYDEALSCLATFEERLPKSKDLRIFKVRGRLILSALERTRGNHEQSYEIAKECLSDVDLISPCILTAEFYVHFATMLTIIEGKKELGEKLEKDLTTKSFKEEAIKFYNKALEHLRGTGYVPKSKADMEQKTYINLAILNLGCSLSGDVVDHRVDVADIAAASTSLERVDNCEKDYPLTGFRKCHRSFALSSLFYRRSQLEMTRERSIEFLESAIEYAEDAKGSVTRHDFQELLRYCQKHVDVYQKELERKKDIGAR